MITLVLGGARSGKSAIAESLIDLTSPNATYVATGVANDDQEFLARLASHRARRPEQCATIECGTDLVAALQSLNGPALIDSLGTWLAQWPAFEADTDALINALSACAYELVIVSDEVGLGVHPSTDVGRAFRDALGTLNQVVARRADRVLLVVAGQVISVKAPSES